MIKGTVINMNRIFECFRLLNSEIGNDLKGSYNMDKNIISVFVSLTRR